jgi:hypothetical protein
MPRAILRHSLLLTAIVIAASATMASAQNVAPESTINVTTVTTPNGQARVTLSTNRFVPAPNDNSDQASKAEEEGRRMIYELAGHECGILRDTIASECRIESININMMRLPANQNLAQRPDGFNVNASVVLRIVPK